MTKNADTKVGKRPEQDNTLYVPARRRPLDEETRKHLRKIAHEMRTPLGTIHIWIGLLQQGQLSEDATTRALEAIRTSTHSLKQIVDRLIEESLE